MSSKTYFYRPILLTKGDLSLTITTNLLLKQITETQSIFSSINFIFRVSDKLETNCSKRDSNKTARHISHSNGILTDITNANVEIILGIRKLGGQILKNDKQSDYEIIERGLLNNEVAPKRDRRMSLGL